MNAVVTTNMTAEQFLALPEDGAERVLIRGQLREKPMPTRNRFHSFAVARLTRMLDQWVDSQPQPRGEVHTGDVGTILRRDPDSTFGIDVAYFSAETTQRQSNETTMMEGAPQLAIEVLSPSDKQEEIREKVLEYLATGVGMVWIVDPYFETVQVHRRNAAPEMFNREQILTGGDILPGLKISVADIFRRPR